MQEFCKHLVADENYCGTSAAIKANYSKKTARVKASQLLARDDVNAYIEHLKAERNQRIKVDADYVLVKLQGFAEADLAAIMQEDGQYKKLREWPKEIRQMINYIEMGEDGRPIKVKLVDKLRSTELLGKHTSVKAFSEIVEHKADPELVRALKDGQGRLQRSE